MAYQFVHLESWSRKPDAKGRSTDFIFDEASRKPIASVHVTDPKHPTVIYGLGIDEVRQMHDTAAAAAMTPGARGKLRKLDSKQKTLHTVVASHPYTVEEVRADPTKAAEVRDWERRTIAWLRKQYGPALKSVLRHTDEKQWHVHAYVLPTNDPQMRAGIYHPGAVAKKAVKAGGRRDGEDGKALNKRADVAYKAAMRDWQDSYHETVAVPCGLTRLGPARRRLTREEWKAEQAQARALQNALDWAEAVKRQGQDYINRTKAEATAAKAELAQIRASTERLTGIGGAVRAVVDGIQDSRIRDQIRKEFARDLAAAKAAVEKAQTETAKAKTSQRNAEKQAAEQRHAFRQQRERLVAAQQEIRALSQALAAALEEPAPTPGAPAP
ncbi:hypothetical protein G6L26_008590 [Agrobacterium radiobacter]|uniref:Mob protein n=1 Tax=Agrobacterium tumefaciens str. B6 TaxID=1183423 RepID=A0A822UZ31_AGRTU|nr:hypothetical protein [Agrobacterium tumefaciens]KWT87907.1 hypothetical protein ASB65_19605 [Agrobacterium tumefaciens str. B6]MQB28391.1 hypothetical protein [Agrobacterium tumefaciens]NTA05242.1 hypothetical protein [Agrobacterium tumefaciens]NTA91837.1 hypothetical protein [Agrobacterium tumefaciens]NTB12987.1 hypothetical protein [Agrobacterium tumefaciens]